MSFVEQAANQGSEGIRDDPNVNPLPPPPLLPSSSSSPNLHPPSPALSNDQLISSMGIQIAQLFSLVGRLSSENEALKAQVGVHSTQLDAQSSSIARLSAENEELKRSREETTKTMEEMSRAFGSHWVWEAERREGEGGKGRWTWSEEKYRRTSDQVVARSKPPPSLDSIPVELFNSIASLLDLPNHLALCGVSFSILELASTFVYRPQVYLSSKIAATFVGARTSKLAPSSSRISPLLLSSNLNLITYNFDPAHLLSLQNHHPIAIHTVSVGITSSVTLSSWSPLLTLLDPVMFAIISAKGRRDTAPTVLRIAESELPFLPRWTRLRLFEAAGGSSVPRFDNGDIALSSCLSRCNPGRTVRFCLSSMFSGGKEDEQEDVAEGELSMVLAREITPHPATKSVLLFSLAKGVML